MSYKDTTHGSRLFTRAAALIWK